MWFWTIFSLGAPVVSLILSEIHPYHGKFIQNPLCFLTATSRVNKFLEFAVLRSNKYYMISNKKLCKFLYVEQAWYRRSFPSSWAQLHKLPIHAACCWNNLILWNQFKITKNAGLFFCPIVQANYRLSVLITRELSSFGGYSTTVYTGRFRPEVQPLTLLYTIFFTKKVPPFVYQIGHVMWLRFECSA